MRSTRHTPWHSNIFEYWHERWVYWYATEGAVNWRTAGVAVGELVADWPVSVEGLPSDVGARLLLTPIDDDRDQTEYPRLPIL